MATKGLRYSMQDPAAASLRALDVNQDGRIDPDEVGRFATAQGLDAKSATEEFEGIDLDGDGTLNAKELGAAFGDEATPQQLSRPSVSQVQPAAAAAGASPPVAKHGLERFGPAIPEPARLAASAVTVVEQLAAEEAKESEAQQLDRQAEELRANSTVLKRLSTQQALEAGAQAAHQKANQLLASIVRLQDQAEQAEVRAASLRTRSKAELHEADNLMLAADRALKESQRPGGGLR